MNLLISKGWRGFLGGGKGLYHEGRQISLLTERKYSIMGQGGFREQRPMGPRAERTWGRLPEQSAGG